MIGPLVGAIVAGIVVISLLVFLFFFLRKRKRVRTEPASFPDKVSEQEKLEAVASITINNNKINPNSSLPTPMYTYSKHQSFNPRLTGISVTTYDDDETATNYEEPLTIQQQLDYIKKQQLKLQREEMRERQRLYMQQNLSSSALTHRAANSPTPLSLYGSYLRYDNGQLNKPSPSSSLHHLGHDSIVSESSVNSVEIRDGHASNIVPIAYIPGVTSNFSSTFASSPSSIRTNNNNNIHSSNNILALSAAQQQRLTAAPTDTYDPRVSYIPVHSAITATRAQPQLVVNIKYAPALDPEIVSIAPDLDRRPEELHSLKSANKSNNSFSDLDSLDSKGLDNELYNEIESYLVHGTNSSPIASNGSEAINSNNNNDMNRPGSTTPRMSTGAPRSPWRGTMPAAQRNSQRSSYRSSYRNSQRTSQPYRLSLRDSTSDDTWRLQPFDYPVVFDNDEDISFVKK
jgi:hypothetical protein